MRIFAHVRQWPNALRRRLPRKSSKSHMPACLACSAHSLPHNDFHHCHSDFGFIDFPDELHRRLFGFERRMLELHFDQIMHELCFALDVGETLIVGFDLKINYLLPVL